MSFNQEKPRTPTPRSPSFYLYQDLHYKNKALNVDAMRRRRAEASEEHRKSKRIMEHAKHRHLELLDCSDSDSENDTRDGDRDGGGDGDGMSSAVVAVQKTETVLNICKVISKCDNKHDNDEWGKFLSYQRILASNGLNLDVLTELVRLGRPQPTALYRFMQQCAAPISIDRVLSVLPAFSQLLKHYDPLIIFDIVWDIAYLAELDGEFVLRLIVPLIVTCLINNAVNVNVAALCADVDMLTGHYDQMPAVIKGNNSIASLFSALRRQRTQVRGKSLSAITRASIAADRIVSRCFGVHYQRLNAQRVSHSTDGFAHPSAFMQQFSHDADRMTSSHECSDPDMQIVEL